MRTLTVRETYRSGCMLTKSMPTTCRSWSDGLNFCQTSSTCILPYPRICCVIMPVSTRADIAIGKAYSAISIAHIPVPVPRSNIRGGSRFGIRGALCNAPLRETRNNLWNMSSRSFSCYSKSNGQPIRRYCENLLAPLYLVAWIHVYSLTEAMEQPAILEVRLIIHWNRKRAPMQPHD